MRVATIADTHISIKEDLPAPSSEFDFISTGDGSRVEGGAGSYPTTGKDTA